MTAESVTDSGRQSCLTPAPALEAAPAPALTLKLAVSCMHGCNHLVSQVAAVDEDGGVAEGQLALAEYRVAHPNDFLKPEGVHPK
eukprot:131276-Rhodomonas_salina.1